MNGKPYIISFTNQKGGVGKTTSCINIAAAIASKGYKVLLIDIDPQGNTTTGVGISKKTLRYTVYDALSGESTPEQTIVKTKFDNLWCLPATIELAGIEFELMDMDHRDSKMKSFIADTMNAGFDFDFIMIDCPPSLSLLTINALTASNSVVIPMQCEYFALEGLTQLMLTIKKIKQAYNPSLNILGILITMFNSRLNLSVQVLEELKKYYNDKLFETYIPRAVKLTEAPSYGEPALYHDKFGKGTQAYNDVADEILTRTGTIVR